MTDDNEARLRFARELAVRAGDLGLTYFRALDTLTIESKGHQDLVSDGDRDVETFIRAAIGAEYPDDGVVGEEHANVAGTSGYVWVIDPIDGTANFVRGIPAWTVVIAGVGKASLDVGVIHEPSTGRDVLWPARRRRFPERQADPGQRGDRSDRRARSAPASPTAATRTMSRASST